jgi:hypothetical protein
MYIDAVYVVLRVRSEYSIILYIAYMYPSGDTDG